MSKIQSYTIFALVFLLGACKPDLDEFTPSSGNANFSRYVAIGNSLTAGYANGALYRSGQTNSYPNMLAQQFLSVGGGQFIQPLMVDDLGIGISDAGTPVTKRVLGSVTDCLENTSLAPVYAGTPDLSNLSYIGNQGPFNNMGVPGVKSFHLITPQVGDPVYGNPYYARFASQPGASTILGDAIGQNPTFFSLWIGSNDVLLYAINGGKEGKDSITDPGTFAQALGYVLTQLKETQAKGMIANVPDITSIPYFTTVPYNGLVLTNQTDVDNLNASYAPMGISFILGQNPFIIEDASAPAGRRQIKSSEYILLTIPQDSLKCAGWGSAKPIPGKYVLDEQEIADVKSATNSYNQTISGYATQFDIAFVDIKSALDQLDPGLTFDGVTLTSKYVSGGAFSLDGVHLTEKGYAVVANEFLRAINVKYEAKIPYVNVTSYSGVEFP